MRLYGVNIVVCLSIAIGALVWRTNNFSSFTYETHRRIAVESSPIKLSDWKLQNSQGETVYLSNLSEKTLLVDFVYTRCPTICRALGSRYQQLQRMIEASGNDQIALLSISIDPSFDTPDMLNRYQARYKGNSDTWHLARPIDNESLQALIDETGLQVIPDEFGGFMHSDAIHLIEKNELTKINNWDSKDWERFIHAKNELSF